MPKEMLRSIVPHDKRVIDISKRDFLKIIGSLGLGFLLTLIFKQKAQALSFGGSGVTGPLDINHFSGTGADYSLTLTNADAAYQCPASANVPNEDYILDIYNGSDTDIYWGWSDDIADTSALRRIIPTTGVLNIDMAINQSLYLVCDSAGKAVAYGTKKRG
jgi:hypothetical protein